MRLVAATGAGVGLGPAIRAAIPRGAGNEVTAPPIGIVVAQLPGVHLFGLGDAITLFVDPDQLYLFGADERLLHAPTRRKNIAFTMRSS